MHLSPSDVLVALASSAEGCNREARLRTLEIIGLFGDGQVHDCKEHKGKVVKMDNSKAHGTMEVVGVERKRSERRNVDDILLSLGEVKPGNDDPRTLRHFSKERDCPIVNTKRKSFPPILSQSYGSDKRKLVFV